jgi:hypothetical protein
MIRIISRATVQTNIEPVKLVRLVCPACYINIRTIVLHADLCGFANASVDILELFGV